MSSNRVFVSPGVYTSENDLTFVSNNVGVTSLGLVGETTKGPAFQPIYISNYAEMRKFFGGLNPEKIKDNNSLRYELPYIAKSYLTNSNQLYVSRVLGLSGYNAGKAWGLAVDGKLVALLRSRGKYVANEVLEFSCNNLTISETPTMGEDFELTTDGGKIYKINLDKTKNNYITRVLGKSNDDAKPDIFVEEIYPNFIDTLDDDTLVVSLTEYVDEFENYNTRYKSAMTPFIVSEIKGDEVSRLFRFETISDGNTANEDIKISISNIKPDDREFDVVVRKFGDTDANPLQLERFSKCNMDPSSTNFIGKRIGTTNGDYVAISSYVLIEMAENEPNSDSFPSGFEGYPVRENLGITTAPEMIYKTEYTDFENKRRVYLGTTTDIDRDILSFNGLDVDGSAFEFYTKGFHMDQEAVNILDENAEALFFTGNSKFGSEVDTVDGPYEKVYSRKFTVNPCGGFDGWDIYRTRRSNTDKYTVQKLKSNPATEDLFNPLALSNGDMGVESDYYAFLEGIRTFSNPEAVNINVFSTPGIDTFDNTNLVEDTIDMIERERSDSLYIVTTPDMSEGDKMTAQDVSSRLYQQFDSNYTATYWPWIQKNDDENNVLVYIPATGEVIKNIALTDNIAAPWYATAGYQRGNVNAIQARKKLTHPEREILYAERINPIVTFSGDGIKIMGNKNLQVRNSPLNRINVRRLLLRARKLISAVSIRLLFEQNDDKLRGEFLSKVTPILDNIRKKRGLTKFEVKLDPTPEGEDRNTLSGKIRIQPTNALEYVDIGFDVTDSGASFDDI